MTMTSTEVRNRWAGCPEAAAAEIPMHAPTNRQKRTDILPLCRKSPSDSRAGPQGMGDVDNHFVRVDRGGVSDRIVRRQSGFELSWLRGGPHVCWAGCGGAPPSVVDK